VIFEKFDKQSTGVRTASTEHIEELPHSEFCMYSEFWGRFFDFCSFYKISRRLALSKLWVIMAAADIIVLKLTIVIVEMCEM